MVCASRSCLGREPDPFLDHFFLIGNVLNSVSQRVDTELGQAPTSHARPRETDHLRTSNLAARTLSLVEHTLSKFGGDPCPLRRGIAAAVKCYVRKARFSRFFLLNRTREARALCGFQHHKRDNLFCILFSGTIIVGLTAEKEKNNKIKEKEENVCLLCRTWIGTYMLASLPCA